MASEVFVRLVAKDDASQAFAQFQKNAKASFAQAGADMQNSITKMGTALDGLKTKASQTGASVGKGLAGAGTAASNLALSFGKALKSVTVFSSATQLVRAFINVVSDAVKTVSKFETAATRLATIGASAAEMARFRDVVLSLNPALGSSEDLMKGVFTAFTRGAESAEHALEITKVAAAGALGQFGSIQDAVSLLTQITNAYAGENIDLTSAMDKLQAVAALGNAEFKDLIPSLGQALPIASSLGISFDNAANSVAQIAKVTGSAVRATTQYRAILTQIAQRANEFAKAGINVREILGERNGLAKVMGLVAQATKGSLFELRNFFTNVRAANGASILTTENLRKMEAAFEAVSAATGLTDRNVKLVESTLGGTFQATMNAIRQTFIKIAGDDSQALRQALVAIANVFIVAGNNASTFQNAAAPLLILFSSLIGVVGSVSSLIFALGEGIRTTVGKVMQMVGSVLSLFKVLDNIPIINKLTKGIGEFGENLEGAGKEAQNFDGVMGQLAKTTLTGTINTMDALGRTAGKWITATDDGKKKTELLTAATNKQRAAWADANAKVKEYAAGVEKGNLTQEEAVQKVKQLNLAQEDQAKAIDSVTIAARDLSLTFSGSLNPAMESTATEIFNIGTLTADQVKKWDLWKNNINSTGSSLKTFSASMDILAGKSETVNTAFGTVFGKTLPDLQKELQNTLKAFNTLSKEGITTTEALADKVEDAVNKAADMFGTNSPITQKFQRQLDDLKSRADQGFKKVFGSWPGEAEKAGKEAVDALANAGKAQGAVYELMTKKLEAEINKQAGILGADSKVVKALEAQMAKLLKIGDLGFKKVFGSLEVEAERSTAKAIAALEDFVPKGRASLEKFAAAVKTEMDKAAAQFGEKHPFTTKLRQMLENAERLLGQGRNALKRHLDRIGVDLKIPAEGAAEKYREAFSAIIASGQLTGQELHKIFVEEVRPKLLETPQGVPQAWEANFGATSRFATIFEERMKRGQDEIGAKTSSTATGFKDDYKAALEEMGVDVKRFTGTWLEQAEARKKALGQEITEAKGLFDNFRGTMDTSLDFGQDSNSILGGAATELARWENMTTAELRRQASSLTLSNEIRAKIMGILEERARETSTSQQQLAQAQETANSNLSTHLAAVTGQRGSSSSPSSPDSRGDALRNLAIQENERLRVLKKQQEAIAAPLADLFRLKQENTSLVEIAQQYINQAEMGVQKAKQQLAQAKAEGASREVIQRLALDLNQATDILRTVHQKYSEQLKGNVTVQSEINRIRREELSIVSQIREVERDRDRRLAGMSSRQANDLKIIRTENTSVAGPSGRKGIAPLGGTLETSTGRIIPNAPTGPTQAQTEANTTAVTENTAALQQVVSSPGPVSGVSESGFRGTGTSLGSSGSPIGAFGVPVDKLKGEDNSLTLGVGATTRGSSRTFAPFQGGGQVPERGLFPLEAGERVLSKATAQAFAAFTGGQSSGFGGATMTAGRGATSITRGQGTFQGSSTGGSLAFNPALNHQRAFNLALQQQAARGRLRDVMGNTTQRTLAKAIVPAARIAIRRRDITKDITGNTALTAQGTATTK